MTNGTKIGEVLRCLHELNYKMQTCHCLASSHHPEAVGDMIEDITGGILRRAKEAQKVREAQVAKFIEEFAEDEREAKDLTRTLRDYL